MYGKLPSYRTPREDANVTTCIADAERENVPDDDVVMSDSRPMPEKGHPAPWSSVTVKAGNEESAKNLGAEYDSQHGRGVAIYRKAHDDESVT